MNRDARARKVAARQPLTGENAVEFEVATRGGWSRQANTPGHVHSLLAGKERVRILSGLDRYAAWCEREGVEAIVPEEVAD